MSAIPTTPAAKRIALLFRRRISTSWSDKERAAFRKLAKADCFVSLDDLELIERYYAAERKKEERGIHRRDLQTFLNNYHSELDRARAWGSRCNPGGSFRRVKEIMRPPELTDEQIAKNKAIIRPLIEQLRRRFSHVS